MNERITPLSIEGDDDRAIGIVTSASSMRDDKTRREAIEDHEERMQAQVPPKETAKETPIEAAKETPIEGVLASDIVPKTGHLFKPGQTGNPGGRRKRPDTQVLALVAAQVPAQLVVDAMIGLLENNSWRAREAGVKLYLSYMIGMPIQRSVTASTKLESILDRVREMDDDEFADVEQRLRDG